MELIIDQKQVDLTNIKEGDIVIAQGKNRIEPSAFMITCDSFDRYGIVHLSNGYIDGNYSSALEATQSFSDVNYTVLAVYSKYEWNLKMVPKGVS